MWVTRPGLALLTAHQRQRVDLQKRAADPGAYDINMDDIIAAEAEEKAAAELAAHKREAFRLRGVVVTDAEAQASLEQEAADAEAAEQAKKAKADANDNERAGSDSDSDTGSDGDGVEAAPTSDDGSDSDGGSGSSSGSGSSDDGSDSESDASSEAPVAAVASFDAVAQFKQRGPRRKPGLAVLHASVMSSGLFPDADAQSALPALFRPPPLHLLPRSHPNHPANAHVPGQSRPRQRRVTP